MSKPLAWGTASATLVLSLALAGCGLSSSKLASEAPAEVAAVPDAAPAAPAAPTLSKSEADALFANARQRGTTATGVNYTITYKPDGTATLEWTYLTQTGRDVGTWRVAEDGAICKTWSQTDGAVEQCERVTTAGDGTYRSTDAATGLDRSTFTIETVV